MRVSPFEHGSQTKLFTTTTTRRRDLKEREREEENSKMEAVPRRSSTSSPDGHGGLVKEEKRADSNNDEEGGGRRDDIFAKVGTKRKGSEIDTLKPSSPKQKDSSYSNQVAVMAKTERSSSMEEPSSKAPFSSTQKDQDDQLESAKVEMGEVREENQRLRLYLDRITKDYQTLQMQFHDIAQHESSIKSTTPTTQPVIIEEEPELFVSLSLGRRTSPSSHDSKKDESYKNVKVDRMHEQFNKQGLGLGLDCKFDDQVVSKTMRSPPPPQPHEAVGPLNVSNLHHLSSDNSVEEQQPREEASETTWPPSKMLKTATMGNGTSSTGDHEEISQVKKARVSVRARCDTPTMNDGCQWRKYGQKISKGNPCPRAYYRCTVAPSCPVRKQVQRCAQDMSILITTYEGTHNHPLPISATAMASTTSAAASMLLSGSSSTSRPGSLGQSTIATTTTAAELHGLNFYLSDNSKSKQFYFPNNMTSISSSSPSSYPTITLDLTSSSTSTSNNSSSHFNRLSSSSPFPPTNPRFSSSSLNFASSESNTNTLPISWSNGLLSYGGGSNQSYNNKNTIGSSISSLNQLVGRQQLQQENNNFYQSYMQKNNNNNNLEDHNQSTIAAATKAIASDPSFQSALAAALTSIIGANNGGASAANAGNLNIQGGGGGALGGGENFGQKFKWPLPGGSDHLFPGVSNSSKYQLSSTSSKGNGNGCASSYLSKPSSNGTTTTTTTTAAGQSAGSLMFLPPNSTLLPFSTSKSASTSPGENRDHTTN